MIELHKTNSCFRVARCIKFPRVASIYYMKLLHVTKFKILASFQKPFVWKMVGSKQSRREIDFGLCSPLGDPDIFYSYWKEYLMKWDLSCQRHDISDRSDLCPTVLRVVFSAYTAIYTLRYESRCKQTALSDVICIAATRSGPYYDTSESHGGGFSAGHRP